MTLDGISDKLVNLEIEVRYCCLVDTGMEWNRNSLSQLFNENQHRAYK